MQAVGWLQNTRLVPMLLDANTPYEANLQNRVSFIRVEPSKPPPAKRWEGGAGGWVIAGLLDCWLTPPTHPTLL